MRFELSLQTRWEGAKAGGPAFANPLPPHERTTSPCTWLHPSCAATSQTLAYDGRHCPSLSSCLRWHSEQQSPCTCRWTPLVRHHVHTKERAAAPHKRTHGLTRASGAAGFPTLAVALAVPRCALRQCGKEWPCPELQPGEVCRGGNKGEHKHNTIQATQIHTPTDAPPWWCEVTRHVVWFKLFSYTAHSTVACSRNTTMPVTAA